MGAREAAKMKKEGLSPGVNDLILISLANNDRPTVLEMKRREGGSLSLVQKEWHRRFELKGWNVLVGHGAEDAIDKLIRLGYDLYGGNGYEG
jgi:hypothetical protein